MKAATGRGGGWAGDFAGEGRVRAGTLADGVRFGNGGEEGLGVGVDRGGVDCVAGGKFDETAEIHHRDAVGDVADDGEVVRDEQHRHSVPGLQVHQ